MAIHPPSTSFPPAGTVGRQALRELSRLYICLQWVRQQEQWLLKAGAGHAHLVVDADVAVNWALIGRETPCTQIFNAPDLARALAERMGRRLFLPHARTVTRTRMSQEHALELRRALRADLRDGARRIQLAQVQRFAQQLTRRERPLSDHELDEIRSFVERCEAVLRGEPGTSAELRGPDPKARLADAPEQLRLELLFTSSQLGLITPEWLSWLLDGKPIDQGRLASRREVWFGHLQDARRERADPGGSGAPGKRDRNLAADSDDAATLALVEEINTCLSETSLPDGSPPQRLLLLTASSLLFQAVQREQEGAPPESVFVRHPLIYHIIESEAVDTGDGAPSPSHAWAGFRAVFESYLQILAGGVALGTRQMFWRAFQLAWPQHREGHSVPLLSGPEGAEAEKELQKAYGDCLNLAETLRVRLLTEEGSRPPSDTAPGNVPGTAAGGVLELLGRLRVIETSWVDNLLQQIIGGVLAQTLTAGGESTRPALPGHRVPILKLDPRSHELQGFMIRLRMAPEEFRRDDGLLRQWRLRAQRQPLRYISLVIDALILCAYEQWAAALSMARRALVRAALYRTPDFADKLQAGSPEADVWRQKQLRQARRVDGREANFVAAHARRYSATTLADLEEAARYLAEFRAMAERDPLEPGQGAGANEELRDPGARDPRDPSERDPRGPSEELALSLAEWTLLRYADSNPHSGRLLAIRRRLQALHARHQDTPGLRHGQAPNDVDQALMRFVYEQTLVNLCVVLIECRDQDLPADPADPSPGLLAVRLLNWIEHEGAGEQAEFPCFIAHVACVLFVSDAQAAAGVLDRHAALREAQAFADQAASERLAYEAPRVRNFAGLLPRAL